MAIRNGARNELNVRQYTSQEEEERKALWITRGDASCLRSIAAGFSNFPIKQVLDDVSVLTNAHNPNVDEEVCV